MKAIINSIFIPICIFCSFTIFAQSGNTLIQNVHVIPLDGAEILLHQDVLIENGKIASISAHSDKKKSKSQQVIDGTNRYLCPGLMDAHPHLPGKYEQGLDMPLENYLLMQLANGVTTLRSMRYEPEFLGIRDSLQENDVICPRLYLSAPMVHVTSKAELAFDYTKADELFPIYKEQGYDLIKYLNGLNPYTHKSLCEASKNSGLPMIGHLPGYIGLDYALSSGQRGIEHFQCYVNLVDEDEEKLKEYILLTKEKGVYNCPTISWYNMYYPYSELDELLDQAGFEYLPNGMKEKWVDAYHERKKQLDELPEDKKEGRNPRNEVLRHFLAAPEMLLLSPGDGDFILPGFSMMLEMKVYKAAGYSPRQILEAGSKNAAASMFAEEQWGMIKQGLDADLVLLSKNPLENIEHFNYNNIEGVFLQGKWLPKSFFMERLEEMVK